MANSVKGGQVVFKGYFPHDQHFDFFFKCFNLQLSHNNLVLNGNGETGSWYGHFLRRSHKWVEGLGPDIPHGDFCSRDWHGYTLPPATLERRSRAHEEVQFKDFPGGPVVRNMPCNAGDVGWITGRGTKTPHAEKQLSLHATREPVCADCWRPSSTAGKSAPQRRIPLRGSEDPHAASN